MSSSQKDLFLDHDFDGIKELDNKMPSWWLYLFLFSFVFSVVYMLHYHVLGTGDSTATEYMKEINPDYVEVIQPGQMFGYQSPWYASDPDITPRLLDKFRSHIGDDVAFDQLIRAAKQRATKEQLDLLMASFPSDEIIEPLAMVAVSADPVRPTGTIALTDDASLTLGAEVFKSSCAVCHGQQGQGGIGPNMIDQYWIHGGSMDDIVHTINVGVPAKGMIPWNKTLSKDKIHQVASFIYSLAGTNPPTPKDPEGELYQRN